MIKKLPFKKRTIIFVLFLGLLLIVFLEFLFIKAELFDYVPNIGIGFHLFGGWFVGLLTYYLFQSSLDKVEWYIVAIFIIGSVSIAAFGWECFEWCLGQLRGRKFQGTLDNTMEDLFIGFLGGVLACPVILLRRRQFR